MCFIMLCSTTTNNEDSDVIFIRMRSVFEGKKWPRNQTLLCAENGPESARGVGPQSRNGKNNLLKLLMHQRVNVFDEKLIKYAIKPRKNLETITKAQIIPVWKQNLIVA